MTDFEPERPVIYSQEEIEQATNNFDEAKKVGEGGYGSVYFGVLREQVCEVFTSTFQLISFGILIKIFRRNHFLQLSGGCHKEDEI